jgi:hypothetical protein
MAKILQNLKNLVERKNLQVSPGNQEHLLMVPESVAALTTPRPKGLQLLLPLPSKRRL